VLLIASVGCHLALQGLGLVFFGAEGLRGPALSNTALTLGPLRFTGQSLAVYGLTIAFIVGLWLFFGFTRMGKALRATAVNRLGARLVGIRTTLSGQIAFLLASVIGAISGILIVPITTLYYDTGFLIGLKGFIAAIIGGLVSYPLTAVAALLVGSVEAFSSFYASNFKEVIVFTLIIPVLLLRSLAAPAVEEEKD
jgi:branched-chain amino acid transport system permease protein